MHYKNYQFTSVAGADKMIQDSDLKRSLTNNENNLQITCENLGGGSYTVFYRVPYGSVFIEHVSGATEQDCVVLAGKGAPIIDALKITFTNTVGNPKIILNTWERGI
jgi:hypothetical protein